MRRLVEYEDYTARVVHDVGIPTAATFGIVELTPEREYLLVTEFLDGAVEIGEATVDDSIIDGGLMVVRRLWDAGLAHRDIKPANLMVHDGQVKLIDVAFVQVRPSPWRQAVDLANMMLVLAVRHRRRARVYRAGLAATSPPRRSPRRSPPPRGIASPTQLRAVMKQDGRDLVAEFRSMAPERRPDPAATLGGQAVRPRHRPARRGVPGDQRDPHDVPPRSTTSRSRRHPTATPAA